MGKAPVKSTETQRQRFIEAAREVGADEDEAAFEQRLRAVVGANSSTGAKEKPKPGKAKRK